MTLALTPFWSRFLRNGFFVFVFCIAIAFLLSAVRYGSSFWVNVVYGESIGLSAWLMIDLGRDLIWRGRSPGAAFWLLVAASIVLGTIGGWTFAAMILGHPRELHDFGTSLVISTVAGVVSVMYFIERQRKEDNERLALEARLKLLQAQIEPHFLFNTLANLRALIPADPARAQAMLDYLNDYLRAALTAARKDRNSLADEFGLLRGYLEILAIRLGARLRYRLELPDALASVDVPPMLLQPLVENAFKHGIEPKAEGGEIVVSAAERGRRIVLTVRDTGNGLGSSTSGGTGNGLALVRERLAALYGAGASLTVAADPAGGVAATLDLPLTR